MWSSHWYYVSHIWFTIPIRCSGTTLYHMRKFLILWMARSTCIQKLAISCFSKSTTFDNFSIRDRTCIQFTSKCHCSTWRNTNQTFQSCVIFVGAEKFSIQLQAAWHLTSNLSTVNIMTRVDLYFPLKYLGIVLSITYLLGQLFICPNLKIIKLAHATNILLTVDANTWNNWARWFSRNPCLGLHMTIKIHRGALKI